MKIAVDDIRETFSIQNLKSGELLKSEIRLAIRESFNLIKDSYNEKNELFTLIQLIDNILAGNISLTKQQIFDYCTSQRYFMKLYMKKMMDTKPD